MSTRSACSYSLIGANLTAVACDICLISSFEQTFSPGTASRRRNVAWQYLRVNKPVNGAGTVLLRIRYLQRHPSNVRSITDQLLESLKFTRVTVWSAVSVGFVEECVTSNRQMSKCRPIRKSRLESNLAELTPPYILVRLLREPSVSVMPPSCRRLVM